MGGMGGMGGIGGIGGMGGMRGIRGIGGMKFDLFLKLNCWFLIWNSRRLFKNFQNHYFIL